MNSFDGTLRGLPKTTEEALRRYLYHYERSFNGPAQDLYRLKSFTETFIYQLRKIAPKFYEEKLPTLINQAGSTLLLNNTNTEDGTRKFHETHCHFLSILKDLKQSQPAGDINFQDERDRIIKRANLFKRQLELKRKIDMLEAAEFDYDVLGEDEYENQYTKTLREIDELKDERKRVNLEIIYMEGEQLEEEPDFQLKVPRNSVLSRLTQEQIKNLEQQLITFYKDNNKKKTALYVDKSIIDGMIEKLGIDTSLYQKEELRELSKNALDAYKSYYREIELQRRNQYHEELLNNKVLDPKDGHKFAGPDDIPEEARRELERNDLKYKRQFEDLLEEYSKRQAVEDTDNIDDDDGDDRQADDLPEIMSAIQRTTTRYARVKEEPRDDCLLDDDDDAGSGHEVYVNEDVAEAVVDGREINWSNDNMEEQRRNYEAGQRQLAQDRGDSGEEADDDQAQRQQCDTEMLAITNGHHQPNYTGSQQQLSHEVKPDLVNGGLTVGQDVHMAPVGSYRSTKVESEEEDEEIECLGTVEPSDKIKTLDVE